MNILGVALFCGPLDESKAAEHAGKDTGRCEGHCNVAGFGETELGKRCADSRGRSVTAHEAGCHQQTEAVVNAHVDLGKDQTAENDGKAELQRPGSQFIEEVAANALAGGLGKLDTGKADSDKGHDDQRPGVVAGIIGEVENA